MLLRWIKWASIVGLSVAVAFTTVKLLVLSVNEDPFVMHVLPSEGGATVQFRQPSRGLVSPKFHVATAVSQETQIELVSDEVTIPSGSVEFHDVTILPGRFRVRMGDAEFDVMEVHILVDGDERYWMRERAEPDRP